MFKQTVIQVPTGKYVIVGSRIPMHLAYKRRDGEPLTEEDARAIAHVGIIGNMKEKFVSVTFETEAEALSALENANEN